MLLECYKMENLSSLLATSVPYSELWAFSQIQAPVGPTLPRLLRFDCIYKLQSFSCDRGSILRSIHINKWIVTTTLDCGNIGVENINIMPPSLSLSLFISLSRDDDMQSTFSAVSAGQDSLQFDEEEELEAAGASEGTSEKGISSSIYTYVSPS